MRCCVWESKRWSVSQSITGISIISDIDVIRMRQNILSHESDNTMLLL